MIERDFGEWGPIWDVYVKKSACIAFVRYSYRYAAEFAKEAMSRQGLIESTAGEVLIVRWANDDPNPVAIARQKREREELYLERLLRSQVHDATPQQKQARSSYNQMVAAKGDAEAAEYYPDTDKQYEDPSYQQGHSRLDPFTQWWSKLTPQQRQYYSRIYGFASDS